MKIYKNFSAYDKKPSLKSKETSFSERMRLSTFTKTLKFLIFKPKQFNVADLLPDKTEKETAEAAAEFFYKISREFEPLAENDIPSSYDRALPELSVPEVAKQLREQKKPGSMVSGDIFPKLINACSDSLAIPLTDIFNCIVRTGVWPKRWKVEYVTLIPKKTAPTSFAEL